MDTNNSNNYESIITTEINEPTQNISNLVKFIKSIKPSVPLHPKLPSKKHKKEMFYQNQVAINNLSDILNCLKTDYEKMKFNLHLSNEFNNNYNGTTDISGIQNINYQPVDTKMTTLSDYIEFLSMNTGKSGKITGKSMEKSLEKSMEKSIGKTSGNFGEQIRYSTAGSHEMNDNKNQLVKYKLLSELKYFYDKVIND